MTDLEFLPQFPLTANPLALFGGMLLAGALTGELVRRVLNLPRITGYVLIGLTLGASGLDVLDTRMLGYTRVFLDIGLGLVLFELGRRINFAWLHARPLAGGDGVRGKHAVVRVHVRRAALAQHRAALCRDGRRDRRLVLAGHRAARRS